MFSLHIWKHKWGYAGGIYAMSCGSSFLSFPISYQLFFFSFLIFFFFSLFFDLKEEERISDAAKTEKAAQFNLSLKRREKRKSVWFVFILMFSSLSLSLSSSLC
jgi:phosphotransferase system  glucose/maltose/N-acetylglucosamine-specific IIC component